jgi:hypothetical protein
MRAEKIGVKQFLLIAPIMGVSFYWMFTYSGPYRYLAEQQIKWFGWYVPKVTLLLIVLGLFGIAALGKLILQGAERPAPVLPQPAGTASAGVGGRATPGVASLQWRTWYLAIPLLMGGYFYLNATQAGALRQLQAEDFGGGRVTSRVVYADVRGQLSRDYMMSDDYMYVPMRQSNEASEPVHVLVGIDKARIKEYLHRQPDGTFVVRGIVQKDLGNDVKAAFEKNGLALAEPCWVVHTGRDPQGDRNVALIVIGISAVAGALGAGWAKYKSGRGPAAQPVQATR